VERAELESRVNGIAEALASIGGQRCDVAVVLGSGLGPFADRLANAVDLPFDAVPELPRSTVPGHAGRFRVGELGGARVLVQSGRVHLYEGWSAAEVSLAARAFGRLGIGALVLTNAAGGLRPEWAPGSLMVIRDHLNLQGETPLERSEAGHGSPWDAELAQTLLAVGAEAGIELCQGVYAGLLGPSYETPAEVRALAWMGADAVGMSTVAEALAGRAEGLRVAGVSCITNLAAGLSAAALSHEEVIEVGRAASERFSRLLESGLPRLADQAPARR
jgi:purine-nucleoside phosphorylase